MPNVIPYQSKERSEEEMRQRSEEFFSLMNQRRSVRMFSDRPIPQDILNTLVRTAGTAPSGANKQPWKFVIVTDPLLKREIRIAAEKEEKESYEGRMPKEWLDDLAALGTDWHKEFLEIAPALIVVFSASYEQIDGRIRKNYYVRESVGIASGFLIAALHNAGLSALTHTPSPMDFLAKILGRPENEKAFLLIPVGYAAHETTVPDIRRKPLDEIVVWK